MELNYYDATIPFTERGPGEDVYKDRYVGHVVEGVFKGFNLFLSDSGCSFIIIIFGRSTRVRFDAFAFVQDKAVDLHEVQCMICGGILQMWDDEPHAHCPNCDVVLTNPNFKFAEGQIEPTPNGDF